MVHPTDRPAVAPGGTLSGGRRGDWTEVACKAGKTIRDCPTASGRIVRPCRAIRRSDRPDGAVIAAGAYGAILLLLSPLRDPVAPCSAVRGKRRVDGAVLTDGADEAVASIVLPSEVVVRACGAGDGDGGVDGAVVASGAGALHRDDNIHVGIDHHVAGQGSLELRLAQARIHVVDLEVD